MNRSSLRVRFAPAPTGIMHLGNVRTALMNYLFAQQKGGTFVLRIEDTDQQRNYDPQGKQILKDLAWLGITHDEGPDVGGPYAPYIQSERESLYQEKLRELQAKNRAYRCFCTVEELEKKRQRQIDLKLPPRYDRTCANLPASVIEQHSAAGTPFIWRMKLDQQAQVTITDLAHGSITFDYKNFSDFPLTRQDGTVTFIFANFVDDMVMKMSHIVRGEDHLTNTACQAALFEAFETPLPTYWHLPILFNIQGKKLSKRDFGFSLHDLRDGGFVPEAIANYLAIIGGGTFEQEIMSRAELITALNFDAIHSTGQIRYDVEKLTWLNHKWIDRLEPATLTAYCLPFLEKAYPAVKSMDMVTLTQLIQLIKTDLSVLTEVTNALHFYFNAPALTKHDIATRMTSGVVESIAELVLEHRPLLQTNADTFLTTLKTAAKEKKIALKELYTFLRLVLMEEAEGPSIADLITMLGTQEADARINKVLR